MQDIFTLAPPVGVLRRSLGGAFMAMALAAGGGAWAQTAGADGATVLVNGPAGPMTRAEVEVMARDLVPAADQARFWANPDAVARFARSLYAQRLLAAEALKAGVENAPAGATYLKLLRERGLAELLLRQREQAEVPNARQLEAYARSEYQAQPDRFKLPEQVRARHILLTVAKDGSDDAAVKAKAEKLLAELRAGADFAKLAQEYSADKGNAARGGDLGEFGRGKMAPEFETAVFALKKPGDLAGPVKTSFGYHIIELTERKPAEMKPFAKVYPELRQEIVTKIETRERQAVWAGAQEQAQLDEAAIKALSAEHAAAAAKP